MSKLITFLQWENVEIDELKFYSLANKKINDEIAALEKEISSDALAETQNLDKNLDAEARSALEDGRNEEERIRQMNINDDERDRLLKQHNENMAKLQVKLQLFILISKLYF